MSTFVLLTRVAAEAGQSPRSLQSLERQVTRAVEEACPSVEWLTSLAIMGPWDYLDIFRAPSVEEALKVAALVRLAGHAQTEVWGATEWNRFREMLATLPDEVGATVLTH